MNLNEIIAAASVGVDRDDLVGSMKDFVRVGAKQIQKEHSYRWMRTRFDFYVFPTDSAVWPLPDGFKELVGEREALSQINDTTKAVTPWTVYAEPQGNRLNVVAWSARQIACLDYEDGQPVLRFPVPSASGGGPTDIHLHLLYYKFLPDLVDGTQVNVLTRDHELMLINKTKAIAFESINDPMFQDFETLYQFYKNQDVASDMQSDLSGRTRVPKDIVQLARRNAFTGADASGTAKRAQTGGENLA